MSITSNASYVYYFTTSDTRTYNYTNDNNYPVKLSSVSFYLATANGTINHGARSDISYINVSKTDTTAAAAKAAVLNANNWSWVTLTGNGVPFSATASISYNGTTINCDSAKTVSGLASAVLGERITSNISTTETYVYSGAWQSTINPSTQRASQTWGTYTYSGEATTFTFNNSELFIPAGATATITLNCNSTVGYAIGFIFKNGTAEPSVVENSYIAPTINTYSATVTNKYNNKILPGASLVTFNATTSNAATYQIIDGVNTLASGNITDNTVTRAVTIPTDSTGTIIFKAISGSGIEVSQTETYTYSTYTQGAFTSSPVSKRCNSGGVEDDEGTYASCQISFSNAKVDGVDITTSVSVSVNSATSATVTSSPLTAVLNANMSTTNSYTVTYTLTDGLTTRTKTDTISVSKYIMHFKENSVGILTFADTNDDVLRIGEANRPVTIKINDQVLSDYVVGVGDEITDYTWHYRKWKSGDIELWCNNRDFTAVSGSSNHVYAHLPAMVTSVTNATGSLYITGLPGGGYISYMAAGLDTVAPFTNYYYIDSWVTAISSAAGLAGRVSFYVLGRWD